MPKISIIVPVYNASKTIERCINSIRSQSFKDFEAIFIDDGSTDDSLAICERLAQEDPRLIVAHKANGGVSSARNAGLSKASGEWIAFADSDDALGADYLKSLYETAAPLSGVDLVVSGYKCVYPNNSAREYVFTGGLMPPQKALALKRLYRYGFPFGKLYRRELLDKHNIRFDTSINMAEDMLFMLEFMHRAENVFVSEACGYNYYFYPASLSKKYWSFDAELKLFCATKKWLEIIGKEYTEDMLSFVYMYLKRVICSMYRPQYRLPRNRRVEILKKIRSEYLDLIDKASPNSMFCRMLKKRRFALVDAAFAAAFLFRYGIFKFLWDFRVRRAIKKQKSGRIVI